MLSLSQKMKQRYYRKMKKQGKIKSTDFESVDLSALSDELKKFYKAYLSALYNHRGKGAIDNYAWDIVEVIEMIDLIVSPDTEIQSHEWAFT